jgi:hypothetical protein
MLPRRHEGISDVSKEGACGTFPSQHIQILLDFIAKEGREDIFKPTIGNGSLHEINNDNGVRLVNFATSKNLKHTMLPHCIIHKYAWTSPDGKTHNHIDHSLIDRFKCT